MPARPTSVSLEPDLQQRLAKDLFNHAWTLLEKPDRSRRETDLMIDAAHACEQNGVEDFDLAYAYEALARAHGLAGEADAAARYEAAGREAAEQIADDDDRGHFLADLQTLPR